MKYFIRSLKKIMYARRRAKLFNKISIHFKVFDSINVWLSSFSIEQTLPSTLSSWYSFNKWSHFLAFQRFSKTYKCIRDAHFLNIFTQARGLFERLEASLPKCKIMMIFLSRCYFHKALIYIHATLYQNYPYRLTFLINIAISWHW